MRLSVDAQLDYTLDAAADLLLAVEVAQMSDQILVTDRLSVSGVDSLHPVAGNDGLGQRTWAHGAGRIIVHYTATVEVERAAPILADLPADAFPALPPAVIQYLLPSRYCQADRFEALVHREFAPLTGGALIAAMADWIGGHLDYAPGASDTNTTAADTYVARRGVCRDFAHLLIALARAAGIPARMVAAYAWDLDPPDFHALCEVWLGGAWHLVDATGLAPIEGMVRIAAGRDATDVSFLTVFGYATLIRQQVRVDRIDP